MEQYHKIQTLWKRESEKPCNMIVGEYATPEFKMLANCTWYYTEKIDGTNVRVIWNGDLIEVKGKTDRAQIQPNMADFFAEQFVGDAPEQLFEQAFGAKPVTLYGECYGSGIQSGGGYIPGGNGVDVTIFDVRIDDLWLARENVEAITEKLGLQCAPIVDEGGLLNASAICADGFPSHYGDREAEGIVCKPRLELQDRRGQRIITKLKKKDFDKLS